MVRSAHVSEPAYLQRIGGVRNHDCIVKQGGRRRGKRKKIRQIDRVCSSGTSRKATYRWIGSVVTLRLCSGPTPVAVHSIFSASKFGCLDDKAEAEKSYVVHSRMRAPLPHDFVGAASALMQYNPQSLLSSPLSLRYSACSIFRSLVRFTPMPLPLVSPPIAPSTCQPRINERILTSP